MNIRSYHRISPRPNDKAIYRTVGPGAEPDAIEASRAKHAAYALAFGHKIVGEYVDTLRSGADIKRPNLQRLLGEVRPGELVLVTCLDRLARSVRDTLNILEDVRAKGAHWGSINDRIDTSTPMGEAFLVFQAAFAQLERRQTSERTRGKMKYLRETKWRVGRHAPYGYRYNMVIVHDAAGVPAERYQCVEVPEEIRVVRALAKIVEGEDFATIDLSATRRRLLAMGYGTIRGVKIYQTEIVRLLKAVGYLKMGGGISFEPPVEGMEPGSGQVAALHGGAGRGRQLALALDSVSDSP